MASETHQLPCLFCCSHSSNPNGLQNEQVQTVYKFLCDILSVNLLGEQDYLFEASTLFPLCAECSITFRDLYNLHEQLLEIQEKVLIIGEEIRNKIHNSEEMSIMDTNSESLAWMQIFRQNIIQQKSLSIAAAIPPGVTFLVTDEDDENQQVVIEDPCVENILHVGSYETIEEDNSCTFYVTEEILTTADSNYSKEPCSEEIISTYTTENPEDNDDGHQYDFSEITPVLETIELSESNPSKSKVKASKSRKQAFPKSIKTQKQYKPKVFTPEELAKRKYKCHMCDNSYLRPSHLKLHLIQQHSVMKNIVCDLCQERVVSGTDLRKHNQESHGQPLPFECPVCQVRRISNKALETHMKIHDLDKNGPFKCELCQTEPFHNRNAFKRHVESHSRGKSFECPLCYTKYGRKEDLMKHMTRKHCEEVLPPGKSAFSCNICPREFSDASILITHLWSHGGKKLPKCVLCQLTFSTTDELNSHNEEIHNSKPIRLPCPHCDLILTSEKLLTHHLKIHQPDKGPKKALCQLCKKVLYCKSTLKRHIVRVHQKLSCDSCDLIFGLRRDLTAHLKLHRQQNLNSTLQISNEKQINHNDINRIENECPGKNMEISHNVEINNEDELRCPHCSVCEDSFENLNSHIESHIGRSSVKSDKNNFKIVVTPL